MGTRADFYVGRGEGAEWLGSIAWDGYPNGLDNLGILDATDETQFRTAVAAFIKGREDGTEVDEGWPWPWDTSGTTDYAYAFDGGAVHASSFGGNWFDPNSGPDEDGEHITSDAPAVFPNMAHRKKVTFGKRSGVIVVTG